MKGLFVYQEGSISSYLQDDLGRTKEYLKKIGIETVEYNRGYQAPQMILIPDDDKNAEIARLTAENKRLREEATEQKSIAAHEHATQMEWFSIAGDYKTENAELRHRAEVADRQAVVLSKWLAEKTRKDYPWQAWLDAAQKQAEKELAEEERE